MAEPEVTIEVVGKRGKCICCGKPGRKRKVRATYKKNATHEADILCITCAKNMGKQLKWAVYYGNPPACCQGTVELGIIAGARHQGATHHRSTNG